MLASNSRCTFGLADVYQVNSSTPVYKDVTLWENGKVTLSTRVVTQCTPGSNLCGMTNVHTVWMTPGTSNFASGAYQFDTQSGVQYCIQTTVWFYESGRWLSQSLTTHVQ